MSGLPQPIVHDMHRAKRLEWLTLIWMSSVVAVMFVAMGSSQAMKTAFLEDLLSLIPAVTFLIAARLEPMRPTEKYSYGFVRVNSLAFLASAVVLTMMGAWLLFDGVIGLVKAEHPTIGPITVFGETVWLGWVMIVALTYSVFPPVILGHLKKPVSHRLRDKVLHTDALMQKADWMTGLAGIAGILGVGLGYWWADSAAAAFISLSILWDGLTNMRTASAELLDGAPRELKGPAISQEAKRLHARLQKRWPEATVRLRESGRYMMASVEGVADPGPLPSAGELMGDDPAWRLARLSFVPPNSPPDDPPDSR
jgi:cation diffusion facilitator family transporter